MQSETARDLAEARADAGYDAASFASCSGFLSSRFISTWAALFGEDAESVP